MLKKFVFYPPILPKTIRLYHILIKILKIKKDIKLLKNIINKE